MNVDKLNFPTDVINAVREVVGSGFIPLHEPEFNGNEIQYLKECIQSTFVSSIGEFVNKFEASIIEYTGAKYCIATVNGTSALHIALLMAGVTTGTEVLLSPLTFVATPNSIVYCGAEPHFVDVAQDDLGIDPVKLRKYLEEITVFNNGQCINKKSRKKISALVIMHTFGNPSKIDDIVDVLNFFNIALVEDAAESLGSFYKGKHTGRFGIAGALSFNGNKIITTGGGGAIITDNEVIAKKARHLTTTAKLPHSWEYIHDEVGFNYRMPNLNAALGLAQIELLEQSIIKKRALHKSYKIAFTGIDGLTLIEEAADTMSNYWLNTIILDKENQSYLEPILEIATKNKLFLRPAWKPMHELEPYSNCQRMNLDMVNSLSKRVINLPSSPNLFTY